MIDTLGYYGEVLIQSALRADLVVMPCKVHTFDASQVVRTATWSVTPPTRACRWTSTGCS